MINRQKKLRIIQFFLLFFGLLAIYFTYYGKKEKNLVNTISKTAKENNNKKEEKSEDVDTFFNIEYSGIDLNGNRYLLKSEEARLDELRPEIIYMKIVKATFYFKDETILYIWSDSGIYNNENLDMKFEKNVRANYLDSELFSDKAEYSNTKNYLSVYKNVRINDPRGNLIADKLLFDITTQKLNINFLNNKKINANIKLDEKRF